MKRNTTEDGNETDEFETVNKLHSPKKLLSEEMEEYGFSDYFGIGDIIAHT